MTNIFIKNLASWSLSVVDVHYNLVNVGQLRLRSHHFHDPTFVWIILIFDQANNAIIDAVWVTHAFTKIVVVLFADQLVKDYGKQQVRQLDSHLRW